MPKISIIVPVYNVAKYLDRSIRSLQNQTLKDIEILLIDDGSTDASLDICHNYQKNDSRIKVFSKENRGVSTARNLGITKANGKYLAFVDPDDWVEEEMYLSLYNACENNNTNISICDFIIEKKGHIEKVEINHKRSYFDRSDILEFLIPNMIGQDSFGGQDKNIMGSVCRLIIKREIVLKHKVYFREDITLMEDLIFCIEMFIRSNEITYVKEMFYHYMKNDNSALTSYREDTMLERIKVNEILSSIFKGFDLEKTYENRMQYRHIKMSIISISYEARKDNPNSFFKKLKTIKVISKNNDLKNAIRDVISKQTNTKTFVLLKLVQYEMSLLLYIYYKIIR